MPDHPPLPTVEQCREFLRLVNVGRVAAGLDPLERLDFDGSTPNRSCNCLSATNLVCAVDSAATVWDDAFCSYESSPSVNRLGVAMAAIGAAREDNIRARSSKWAIPDAINVVTKPFDARTPGLRERMAEAGVI